MHVEGSCHCGAVRWEAEVDPARATLCNCTDCQVLSGSPFRVSVPTAAVSFIAGTPARYVKTADSGNRRAQGFCADCGTPIYASADEPQPAVFMLRVGPLAQRAELPPVQQIFCDSQLGWSSDIHALPGKART